MVAFATRADLHRYGLPKGQLVAGARVVAEVHLGTSRLELADHGYELDAQVALSADEGATLPAPLAEGTVYFVRPVAGSSGLLELAATAGGDALALTNAGEGTFRLVDGGLDDLIDAELEAVSDLVRDAAIAIHPPVEPPFPSRLVSLVARIAAARLARAHGLPLEHVFANAEEAERELAAMRKGAPIRDTSAPPASNLATSRSAKGDPRGWGGRGGTLP